MTPEGKTLPPTENRSIILPVGSNITLFSTSKIVLTCPARGVPKPTVRWKANGTDITSSGNIFVGQNSLNLINVSPNDALKYSCIAENPFGKDTKSSSLTILGKCLIRSNHRGGSVAQWSELGI